MSWLNGLFLVPLLIPAQATEPASAPDAERFATDLASVRTLMQVGRWDRAKERLLVLLEEHRDEPYVRRRFVEVRALLRRCSFGASGEPARPEDVIEAEVLAIDFDTGQVHLVHRAADEAAGFTNAAVPQDFERSASGAPVWVHPLVWSDSWTLRVTGPAAAGSEPLQVVLASEQAGGEGWAVIAGEQAGLVRLGPDGSQEVVGAQATPVPGRPYQLQISVDDAELRVALDGRHLARTRLASPLDGRIRFQNFGGARALEFEGRAELAWILRRLDDVNTRARLAFLAGYSASGDLPEWLAALEQPETDPADVFQPRPASASELDSEALERAELLLAAGDAERGVAFARQLAPEVSTRHWIAAVFLAELGRDEEALAELDTDAVRAPSHFAARRLRCEVIASAHGLEVALAELRSLRADFPSEPNAYADLARGLLLAGSLDEVSDLLDEAFAAGLRSWELQLVEDVLLRGQTGPDWPRTNSYSSHNYNVHSDLSRAFCLEASRVLEASRSTYEMRLGRIPRDGQRFDVYVFSGQGSYLLYTSNLLGIAPTHTAGLYAPALRQLLAWNQPRRSDLIDTLRHEGFHQYLHARCGSSPTWLNEGLAEYFEHGLLDDGRWSDEELSAEHLEQLRAPGFEWTPLAELLHAGPAAFYAEPGRSYAEAWHWIHYLENSGVANQRALRRLVDALAAGTPHDEAIEVALPARGHAALERGRRAYLRAD